MNFTGEIVAGQKQRWSLVEKLGEGDAGEVFLIEALLTHEQAILKRPHASSIASETLRQAKQIQKEGQILQALQGQLGGQTRLATPRLLDQSDAQAGYGETTFIVIEKAPGLCLNALARAVRVQDAAVLSLGPDAPVAVQPIAARLAAQGQIPPRLVLQVILGVIELFEKIHFAEVFHADQAYAGIIWNDVKSDHLYWEPVAERLTVIDWGNSDFLESSGVTKDRRHSRAADYAQFIEELGRFTAEHLPELHRRLKWPLQTTAANAYTNGVKPLKKRVLALLEEYNTALQELRAEEQTLFAARRPSMKRLEYLQETQARVMDFGVAPDYAGAAQFYLQAAARLLDEHQFADFESLCLLAGQQPNAPRPQWELLRTVAANNRQLDPEILSQTLLHGVQGAWDAVMWSLLLTTVESGLPLWWEEVANLARQLQLDLSADLQPPYVMANRVYYTLQAAVMRRHENGRPAGSNGAAAGPFISAPADGESTLEAELSPLEALARRYETEIIRKWKEIEPAPPHAGLDYTELERLLEELEAALPGAQETLRKTLAQPVAQVGLVLEAWGRKDFDQARRGLRRLLLWDPHRRRVITADQAIRRAPNWLARVRNGARTDEPFQDYLVQMALSGRELRNQVGPARWLTLIIDAFKGLRTGARSADMLMEHPELLNEMPWLNEARGRETLNLPGESLPELDTARKVHRAPVVVRAQVETRLRQPDGLQPEGLQLGQALDVWAAEAQGSSARVFAGHSPTEAGPVEMAVKIMRPDRVDYALPLFREEAHVLLLLQDVPGVNRLLECGFLRFEPDFSFTDESAAAPVLAWEGDILRYPANETQNFLMAMDTRIGQGWVPYLGLEKQDQKHNLLHFCDAGRTHGRFLPLRESLLTALQICDILQAAHERNIVYRDHKILHYYWNPGKGGVYAIDWNIAKRYPQGLSSAERQFDLVQFGARALHHIVTGRAAPGALPLGPNRPEEIERASSHYTVQWTYDDERLPNRIKELLAAVLAGDYAHVRDLKHDLHEIYQQLTLSAENQGR